MVVTIPNMTLRACAFRKKADLDFQPRREHEQQPPKITEELHDRVVQWGDVQNIRPEQDTEG